MAHEGFVTVNGGCVVPMLFPCFERSVGKRALRVYKAFTRTFANEMPSAIGCAVGNGFLFYLTVLCTDGAGTRAPFPYHEEWLRE